MLTKSIPNILIDLNSGDIKCGVSRTLTHLGIMPNLKGHFVLREAILDEIETHGLLCKKKSGYCNPTAIGNMRSALRAAKNSGQLMRINDLLRLEVADKHCHFTPAQFVALIAHFFLYSR